MGEWETRKLKSEFVWFNSLILFFVIFFSSIFFSRFSYAVFFSSTKSTKATSKKFKMYGSLWLHPQRWTTNTCQISDITIVSPTMLGSCICFVIITSFTRYYLLGGPSLILVVVFFSSSACLWCWTNKNAHNLSHQHPMNGTRYNGIYNRA